MRPLTAAVRYATGTCERNTPGAPLLTHDSVSEQVTACKSMGDGVRVRALLQALRQPLPRVWELRDEEERNSAALEEDLTLPDAIAEAEALDEVRCTPLFTPRVWLR